MILEFDKQAKVIMISALDKEDVVKKCLVMGTKCCQGLFPFSSGSNN
jgi:hypothetical protein